MDLADLWRALDVAGVRLSAEGQRIRAQPASALTDELRDAIRRHRWQVLELIETEQEAVHLLTLLRCGPDHPDHREALALALADPRPHLEALRTSVRLEGLA